jgi:hypothetical protein
MSEPRKRGRPPLFGKAMTAKERKQRHQAARYKHMREAAPDLYPNIMTAEQVVAMFGLKTMSPETLAALRAQPGGDEPFDPDDDAPPVDEFGEPVYPGDSGSL